MSLGQLQLARPSGPGWRRFRSERQARHFERKCAQSRPSGGWPSYGGRRPLGSARRSVRAGSGIFTPIGLAYVISVSDFDRSPASRARLQQDRHVADGTLGRITCTGWGIAVKSRPSRARPSPSTSSAGQLPAGQLPAAEKPPGIIKHSRPALPPHPGAGAAGIIIFKEAREAGQGAGQDADQDAEGQDTRG
jgi:hypothetical protein